jgi:nucleoside recognition membrane protein YjiH
MGEGRIEGRNVTLLSGALALALTVALIAYSQAGFQAAAAGLRLFFDVVLPSLLPFFILSEVLLAFGVVHFLGEWFEPIMRPVFNVPGVGSFVFSMGLAAGYPMDAVLTARLRRQRLCTRVEGERLLAFTNSADPVLRM